MAIVQLNNAPLPEWARRAINGLDHLAAELARKGLESEAAAIDRSIGWIRIGTSEKTNPPAAGEECGACRDELRAKLSTAELARESEGDGELPALPAPEWPAEEEWVDGLSTYPAQEDDHYSAEQMRAYAHDSITAWNTRAAGDKE